MQYSMQSGDLADYLAESPEVDYGAALIRGKAKGLFSVCRGEEAVIQTAFVFVRDFIAHSVDIGSNRVIRRATDVLRYGEGTCHAKAMLMAALLRCVRIPTGFCYQRVARNGNPAGGFVLHALNAVYLSGPGLWTRLDARGNDTGCKAEFFPDDPLREQLAFTPRPDLGERDYPTIYAAPLPCALSVMRRYRDCEEMLAHLPDAVPDEELR